jgi:hypothetical protein
MTMGFNKVSNQILFDNKVVCIVGAKEEDLVGNFVKAHGHFEFMLRRGNKVVCIIEAKKDDVEQGMAQDLVGCEVGSWILFMESLQIIFSGIYCAVSQ